MTPPDYTSRTWYIFRHGLATHSTTGYGDDILTASILPESVPVIERLAARLKNIPDSTNISSPLPRCRQTVDIVSRVTGKRFGFDDRLTEYYQESFSAFRKRIENFLMDIITTQTSNILICTHGSILAGLKHFILEGNFLEQDLYDYTGCGELLLIRNRRSDVLDFRIPKGDV